jgi:TonB family protein
MRPVLAKTLTLEPLIKSVPEEKRRLGFFLFLAALAHFVGFIFIEVRYPPPHFPAVSGLRVMFDNSGQLAAAGRPGPGYWSGLLDPSNLIVSREPLIKPGDLQIKSAPIFQKQSEPETRLAGLAREPEFLPDHIAPLVDRVKSAFTSPPLISGYPRPRIAASRKETVLELSQPLQSRLASTLPPLPKAVAASLTEAGITILRIGIDETGQVQYALVEQSCGKSATDELGIDALRRVRFESAGPAGITWGRATVYWQFESGISEAGEAGKAP